MDLSEDKKNSLRLFSSIDKLKKVLSANAVAPLNCEVCQPSGEGDVPCMHPRAADGKWWFIPSGQLELLALFSSSIVGLTLMFSSSHLSLLRDDLSFRWETWT